MSTTMRLSIPAKVQKEIEGCGGLAELLRKQPSKKALKDASKRFLILSMGHRLRIIFP